MKLFKNITTKEIEHEYEHETIDSLFFSYYPTEKEKKEAKDLFIKNFNNFSFEIGLKNEHISFIENELYSGNSLEELQSNTNYMHKDIAYIYNRIIDKNMYPPILLFKKNNYSVISGRTRMSIAINILKKEVNAIIIDYDKMMEYIHPLKRRREDFIENGYDILAFESTAFRKRLLTRLNFNNIDECLKLEGEIWSQEKKEIKLEILMALKKELGCVNENKKTYDDDAREQNLFR